MPPVAFEPTVSAGKRPYTTRALETTHFLYFKSEYKFLLIAINMS